MKISNKKLLIHSLVLAFIVSFFTSLFLFPDIWKSLYTNVNWVVNISSSTLIKAFITLLIQTSLIWSIFYNIAKKIFLDKEKEFTWLN